MPNLKDLPFEYPTRWSDLGLVLKDAAARGDDNLWHELIALLEDRDRQLEDFLSREAKVFPRDSAVSSFRSMPWTPKDFGQIKHWNVEMGQDDAGVDEVQAVPVDVELHINGTVQRTMTLPTGDVYVEYEGELPTTAQGDRVTVYCEQTGFTLVSTVSF